MEDIQSQYIGVFTSSENDVIACNNKLPWDIPEDINFFRKLTHGHIVIMGRKTFHNLGMERGLPGKINIIITHKCIGGEFETNSSVFYTSLNNLPDILEVIQEENPNKKIFIIGGPSIFQQFEAQIDTWYITKVKRHYLGDITYSPIDLEKDFVKKMDVSRFYSENEECEVVISKWVRRNFIQRDGVNCRCS